METRVERRSGTNRGGHALIRHSVSDLQRVWRVAPLAFTFSAVFSWLVALAPAGLVLLTAQLVNQAVKLADGTAPDATEAAITFALIVILTLMSRFGTGLARYLETVASLRVNTTLAEEVMAKGTRMSLSSYENPDHYNALRRASAEVQAGRATRLVMTVIGVVGSFVTVGGIGLVLASWNPIAAVLAICSPIPAAWASILMNRRRWRIDYDRANEQRLGTYLQWLSTNDQTYKEVSHYRIGPTLTSRFGLILQRFLKVDREFSARSETFVGTLDAVGASVSLVALALAVSSAIESGEVGQLAGFLQSIGSLQASTTALMLGIAGYYEAALYSRNLFGFLEIPDAEERRHGLSFPSPLRSGVEFREVCFRYPGTSRDILGPISFSIPSGTSVAVVGRNGAGKSTLIKLLCGLYEPTSGEILIDGKPLAAYTSTAVRRGIGVVFQDFAKFELSAKDSITFGAVDKDAHDDQVVDAAIRAGVHDRLANLTNGYDTLLGRRFLGAEQLSIGEWQRLALARCVYSDAPLRVLDEPSAALDPISERDLVSRVLAVGEGATTVVVAHRFATIRSCDRIVLLESGQVREEGTHSELMRLGGTYAEMYRSQATSFQDPQDNTDSEYSIEN